MMLLVQFKTPAAAPEQQIKKLNDEEDKMNLNLNLTMAFNGGFTNEHVDLDCVNPEELQKIMDFKELIEKKSIAFQMDVGILSIAKNPGLLARDQVVPAADKDDDKACDEESNDSCKVDMSSDFGALIGTSATKAQIWRFANKFPASKDDALANAERLLLTAATSLVLHDTSVSADELSFDLVKEVLNYDLETLHDMFNAETIGAGQKIAADAFASFAQGSTNMQLAAQKDLISKLS